MNEDKPWHKYKKKLEEEGKSVKPWDLINPKTEWVDDKVALERFSICGSCPELINLTNQCKKCGCFMSAKTKLKKATCPLGKW